MASRDEAPHGLAIAALRDYVTDMRQRVRKAWGTFATVLFLIVYSLIAMAVGGNYVVGAGLAAELVYFAVAGVLWLPVVMALIRWMARPDPLS